MFSTSSLRFMLSCVNALKGVLEDEILRSTSFPLPRPPPAAPLLASSKVGAEKVGAAASSQIIHDDKKKLEMPPTECVFG
jgi:hypothetical protein